MKGAPLGAPHQSNRHGCTTTSSPTSPSPLTPHRLTPHSHMSFTIHGIGVSGGIAIGRAHLLTHTQLEVQHYDIAERRAGAGDGALRQGHPDGAQRARRAVRSHPGERAAGVRGFSQPASDDSERQHAVRGAQGTHCHAAVQRRMGADAASRRAARASSIASRTTTCANARPTSCRWLNACSRR